jgi:hypothetical protein
MNVAFQHEELAIPIMIGLSLQDDLLLKNFMQTFSLRKCTCDNGRGSYYYKVPVQVRAIRSSYTLNLINKHTPPLKRHDWARYWNCSHAASYCRHGETCTNHVPLLYLVNILSFILYLSEWRLQGGVSTERQLRHGYSIQDSRSRSGWFYLR